MAQTAAIKSLLTFGKRVGYLQANLGELFKLKAVPADRARRIMSEADTFILLRSAETERDRLILETAYYGALRVSELVSLTWERCWIVQTAKCRSPGLSAKAAKSARFYCRRISVLACVSIAAHSALGRSSWPALTQRTDPPGWRALSTGCRQDPAQGCRACAAIEAREGRRLASLAAPRTRAMLSTTGADLTRAADARTRLD